MKKITILFACIIFASYSFGQWSVGPRLGVNFSTVSGENYWGETKHKWITGFVVGAVGEYALTDLISLDAELLYITSGAKYLYDVDEESRATVEGYWKESYGNLQIPILVKATIGDDIRFYGNAGPYFSLIIHGKYKDKVEDYNYERSGKIKFKERPDNYDGDDWYLDPDEYNKYDIGIYIGAGAEKKLGPGVLVFDARFGLGFIDSNKFEDKNDKPDDYKAYKNRNISLTLAYMFGFGKDTAARFYN